MQKNENSDHALELVDARRRGFLTKLLAGGAAAAALPAMSTVALGAEPGQGGGKGKGGKGKGGAGKGGAGKGGGTRDPQAMAARMIQEHDRDGDGALNARELANALTAMAERRAGGQGAGGQGPGGAGKGKGAGGAGKGKGGGAGKGKGGAGGGVRPQRPSTS